jgi:hypothetical protein
MGYVALILGIIASLLIGVFVYVIGLLIGRRYSIENIWLKALPIAIVMAVIGGCALFWVMGDSLMSSMYPPAPSRKPAEQDIVGLWQLTESSLESIRKEGYEPGVHAFEFRDDGTFVMTNLPDMVWNFGESGGEFESGSGTWNIETDVNGNWSIRVHFTEMDGVANDLVTYFYLYGNQPPYLIYDYVGDPDSGYIITFERR